MNQRRQNRNIPSSTPSAKLVYIAIYAIVILGIFNWINSIKNLDLASITEQFESITSSPIVIEKPLVEDTSLENTIVEGTGTIETMAWSWSTEIEEVSAETIVDATEEKSRADSLSDIVDSIKVEVNKAKDGWSLIWKLTATNVQKVFVTPQASSECDLDTATYQLKAFTPWSTTFKYNFKLSFGNVCEKWAVYTISLIDDKLVNYTWTFVLTWAFKLPLSNIDLYFKNYNEPIDIMFKNALLKNNLDFIIIPDHIQTKPGGPYGAIDLDWWYRFTIDWKSEVCAILKALNRTDLSCYDQENGAQIYFEFDIVDKNYVELQIIHYVWMGDTMLVKAKYKRTDMMK